MVFNPFHEDFPHKWSTKVLLVIVAIVLFKKIFGRKPCNCDKHKNKVSKETENKD